MSVSFLMNVPDDTSLLQDVSRIQDSKNWPLKVSALLKAGSVAFSVFSVFLRPVEYLRDFSGGFQRFSKYIVLPALLPEDRLFVCDADAEFFLALVEDPGQLVQVC